MYPLHLVKCCLDLNDVILSCIPNTHHISNILHASEVGQCLSTNLQTSDEEVIVDVMGRLKIYLLKN